MELVIEIHDQVKWERLGQKVIRHFLESSKEGLVGEIKKKTPVITNNLRGGWTPKLYTNELRVQTSVSYAPFVEKGTGIYATEGRHRIFPKKKEVMHAVINGEDVFFRNSRGQPGQHMAEKGAEAFKPRIPQMFQLAMLKTGYTTT